jgi:hypothetical protein
VKKTKERKLLNPDFIFYFFLNKKNGVDPNKSILSNKSKINIFFIFIYYQIINFDKMISFILFKNINNALFQQIYIIY